MTNHFCPTWFFTTQNVRWPNGQTMFYQTSVKVSHIMLFAYYRWIVTWLVLTRSHASHLNSVSDWLLFPLLQALLPEIATDQTFVRKAKCWAKMFECKTCSSDTTLEEKVWSLAEASNDRTRIRFNVFLYVSAVVYLLYILWGFFVLIGFVIVQGL